MMSKDEPIDSFSNNKYQLVEISTVLLSEFTKALSADNFDQLLAMDRSDYEKTINNLIKETSSFRELIAASSDNVMKDAILKQLKKSNNYLENLLFEYKETTKWYFINLSSSTLELIKNIVEEIHNHQSELQISDKDKDKEEEQFWMDFETTLTRSIEGYTDTALMPDFAEDCDVPLQAVLPSDERSHDYQQMFLPEEELYPRLKTSIMAEISEETSAREKMSVDDGADAKDSEKESTVPEQENVQELHPLDILPIEIIDYIYRIGLGSCTSIQEGRTFISAFMLFGGHYRIVAADKHNAGTGIQLLESLICGSWRASALEAVIKKDKATLLETIMISDGDVANGTYLTGTKGTQKYSAQLSKLHGYLTQACEQGSIHCMKYLFSLNINDVSCLTNESWKGLIDKSSVSQKIRPLLVIASENGHAEIVNLLLSMGAHPNTPYIEGGRQKAVTKILTKINPAAPMDHPGRFETPLLTALVNNHFDIARTFYPPRNFRIKINTQAVMRELLISLLKQADVEHMKSVLKEASELLKQPVDINFRFKEVPFIELIMEELKPYITQKDLELEYLIDVIEYLFELVDAERDKREDKGLLQFLGLSFTTQYLNKGIQLNNPRMMNIVLKRMSQTELAQMTINEINPKGDFLLPGIAPRDNFPPPLLDPVIKIAFPLIYLEAAHCMFSAGVPFTLSHYKILTQTAITKKDVNVLTYLIMHNHYSAPQMSIHWADIIHIFLAAGNLNERNPMILLRLIEMGADLSLHVDMGKHLIQALEQGDLEIARNIVTRSKYEFKSKSVREAVLTLVAKKEYCDIALLLLQNNKNHTLVISFTPFINQFIIAAIKHNHRDLIGAMFELPAFRNHKTQLDKKHFFECALQYNRLGMLQFLFNRLTSPESGYYPPLAVIKSSIVKSIETGNAELLTLILSCCPNAVPALASEEFSFLPSRSKINLKIAHILLENNMMLDKRARQELPWLAVEANDIELIRLLVRTKQNNWLLHHEFNEKGETLHSRAYKLGHTELASLLIKLDDDKVITSPLKISNNRYGFLKRKECEDNNKPAEEIYKNAKSRIV